jgi:hypothetical protein
MGQLTQTEGNHQTKGGPLRRPMTPRPVQHGGGVELDATLEPPSVPRVRAGCGGRLFTAKLGVIVHFHASDVRSVTGGSSYPDGSAGTVGRKRWRDRPRHMLPCDRVEHGTNFDPTPCWPGQGVIRDGCGKSASGLGSLSVDPSHVACGRCNRKDWLSAAAFPRKPEAARRK